MKIVYDLQLMKYISLFEKISNAKIKDLFERKGQLYCVVKKEEMNKIIGPKGKTIQKIQNMIKKKVKVIGYTDDVKEFVKGLLYPFTVENIENKDGVIEISCNDTKTKGLLIGRERQNLSELKQIVSRYFDINDIKVI